MAYAKIRPRRGSNYEWETVNPTLDEGEFAIEYPETGVGTGLSKFKIGDGVRAYHDLPYAFDGTSAFSFRGGTPTDAHILQLRGGTTEEWELANPTLELYEPGYDSTRNDIKIGDGVSKWKDLKYMSGVDKFVEIIKDKFGNEIYNMDFGDEQ